MKIIAVVFLLILCLVGCETEPMRFDNPGKFASKVQYFRDAKGNCFAIIGIRKAGYVVMSGVGFTLVDQKNCNEKE